MTTTVTIKHEGPGHHDVAVLCVNPQTGTPGTTHIISANAQVTLVLHDGQELQVNEVPKAV